MLANNSQCVSLRSSLLGIVSCAFLLFALSHSAIGQNDLTLQLDPVNNQNVDVSFEPATATIADKPVDSDLKEMTDTVTLHHRYRLYADPREVAAGKFSTFFIYTFFAYDFSQQRWSKFETKAVPAAFVDTRQLVHFTLERGQSSDEGSIDLPLHSFGSVLIGIPPLTAPFKVGVSSGGSLELEIQNLSPTLRVTIPRQAHLKIQNTKLWASVPGDIQINDGRDVSLPPAGKSSVTFVVVPNRVHALLATLTALKPEQPHDHVSIEISYAADQGGVVRSSGEISVPIRFEPSLPNLMAALLIGSFLGTLASQLLPGVWKDWRELLRQAGRAVVLSVIAEILAMLLVGLGSRFVIFTFDLDPWQFLPVLVIGLLVSGGKKLLEAVGLGKSSHPARATHVPARAGGPDA